MRHQTDDFLSVLIYYNDILTVFSAEGRHSTDDYVVAVLAGDFRASYFYHLLKPYPVCNQEEYL